MTADRTGDFGVAVVVLSSAGQVLLHLRDDDPEIAWPGHWSLISGLAEPGETPLQAMERELAEETGLALPLTQQLEYPPGPDGGGVVVFTARWDGDAAALPLTEGVRLQWHPPDAVKVLRVPPWVHHAVLALTLREGPTAS
ncbi:NUDIX domain-containing protein [Actinomadura rupiterrae]|uniref:NUDIX domain-containing protein n=1 Tax=Actinomadura rupiterrae TaxID=559627 RepID=UPI0020A55E6D|nr:NUDIX domain-containing protein [Actinomadura rupiterrae]MCP2339261.1 8-oxo-dGTP diphosphatase [Actinomadura rupiterrae]